VRDISLLAALPNVAIVQPGSWEETRGLVRWAVEEADETVALRLVIGPSPRRIELPAERPAIGRGSVVRDGDDAVLVTYGPVMLHEALVAAEELADGRELSLRVVALPWLNRFDADWLAAEVAPFEHLFVLEDHAPVGGLGDGLRAALPGRAVSVFGVEGWPACGSPDEALRFHGLDGASLAARIAAAAGRGAERAASSAAR
jgi:transketolase